MRADLEAPAPFADLHEYRCAPRAVVAAAHQTLAILTAEDERRLLQPGNDDHAFGLVPELLRNVFVGDALNLFEDGRRFPDSPRLGS